MSVDNDTAYPSTHKTFLGLCGNFYQVRVINGERQILYEGKWIAAHLFVDFLASKGEWDKLCDIIRAGYNLI